MDFNGDTQDRAKLSLKMISRPTTGSFVASIQSLRDACLLPNSFESRESRLYSVDCLEIPGSSFDGTSGDRRIPRAATNRERTSSRRFCSLTCAFYQRVQKTSKRGDRSPIVLVCSASTGSLRFLPVPFNFLSPWPVKDHQKDKKGMQHKNQSAFINGSVCISTQLCVERIERYKNTIVLTINIVQRSLVAPGFRPGHTDGPSSRNAAQWHRTRGRNVRGRLSPLF